MLQQRANTGFMDGKYDGSATGHVEPNESIHEAALRELEEEIGVKADVNDLKLVLVAQMDVDKPYLNFAFICERWEGEPRIAEPEKNTDLVWHDISLEGIELTPMMSLLRERKFEGGGKLLEYVNAERREKLLTMVGLKY